MISLKCLPAFRMLFSIVESGEFVAFQITAFVAQIKLHARRKSVIMGFIEFDTAFTCKVRVSLLSLAVPSSLGTTLMSLFFRF